MKLGEHLEKPVQANVTIKFWRRFGCGWPSALFGFAFFRCVLYCLSLLGLLSQPGQAET